MEDKNTTVKKESVPIWEKYALTIYEAAEYFNIGEHRLRQLVRENRQADFVLWIAQRLRLYETYLKSSLMKSMPSDNYAFWKIAHLPICS